jgi:hypothetical protein
MAASESHSPWNGNHHTSFHLSAATSGCNLCKLSPYTYRSEWIGDGLSIIASASTNYVEDDVIGLNENQTAVPANTGDGVYMISSNNFVGLVGKGGDLEVANGNVISGNGNIGVEIAGGFAQSNTVDYRVPFVAPLSFPSGGLLDDRFISLLPLH